MIINSGIQGNYSTLSSNMYKKKDLQDKEKEKEDAVSQNIR